MSALVLNIFSAIAAICAGVLWFISTRVSVPHVVPTPADGWTESSVAVDTGDRKPIDPFATGLLQAMWSRWAAVAASAAAILQAAAIVAGTFSNGKENMHQVVGYFNVIGLIAGFIGGVVTFFYGLPNIDVLNSGGYVEMQETDSIRRYKLISKIGVGLIAGGFLMQLPSAIFSINQ